MRLLTLIACLCLLGCDSDAPADAGDGLDATASDAGSIGGDAGAFLDAASTDDAGTTDAGTSDGGTSLDGGTSPDAATPDAGPVSMPCVATGACDPFDPSSCPMGQKCRVLDTGTECRDLTSDPPLGAGAPCTADTQCGPTLWCVSFDGAFTCMPMCPAGSIGACGPDAACLGSVGTETCARVCRPIPPRCDIYAQDCGDATQMCTLATHPETFENYTGCRPNGTLALDETCGGDLGRCERGLICIREGMASTCRAVCGPDGAAPTCATGECTGLARSWGVPYCRG